MNEYTNIIDIFNTSKGNYVLRVEKKNIKFNAGQFFSIGLDEIGINREYSVASSDKENFIDFFIREVEGGALSKNLRFLKKGDKIKILGPYGEFYIRDFDVNAEYIFFATGTGIAPFISLIDTHKIKKYKIFHGVREIEDCYSLKKLDNYNLAVSREKLNTKNSRENLYIGRINQFLNTLDINKNMLFFLCGNSLMVSDLYDDLLNKNVKQDRIFTEIFF